MTTKAPYSDDLRPALACVNNRPERTSRWPERWMIHRRDGSFTPYLVNWEVRSAGNFQPFLIRIPELIVPEVVNTSTAPTIRERRQQVSGVIASMNAHTLLFGDEEMTERDHIQGRGEEAKLYASHEDFHTIFNGDLKELYQLSLLLARDPAKAERCLVNGLEDCVSGNRVFREWARSWAKRTIVQNAIRELQPRPSQSTSRLSGAIVSDMDQHSRGPGGHFELDAVLRLADFDRFVFVMSVLEHYSEYDCALLLDCSAKEIREARTRALKELIHSSQMDLSQHRLFVQERK